MTHSSLRPAESASARRAARSPFRLTAVAGLLLLWLVCGCQPQSAPSAGGASGKPKYHCPMHPTYVSDRPGDCPICNMKLTPIEADDASSAGASAASVTGRIPIHVSPEKQQLIGLRTAPVELRELSETLRLPGVLQHDETGLARIAPRMGGWIRKLHVSTTGQSVAQGEPLLTLYSPELLTAERDYLLARQQASAPALAADQRDAARRLQDAARDRLRLFDVGAEEIQALEARGQAADELLLRSPVAGHVIAKTAIEGRAFMAGETLFEIGQLDRLWVVASVPETALTKVRAGQAAKVRVTAAGGRAMDAAVSFVSPHLDPRTRRGEVRLILENREQALRPEMWAEVELDLPQGRVLTAPASAIIDTGTRCVAFVRRADDHLEPREVQIGARTDEGWEVLSGLAAGEQVVTRALFLIDSESQLKAAVAGMTSDHPAAEHTP